MNAERIEFRASETQHEAWKVAAARDGYEKLSRWIRDALDDVAGRPSRLRVRSLLAVDAADDFHLSFRRMWIDPLSVVTVEEVAGECCRVSLSNGQTLLLRIPGADLIALAFRGRA